MLSKKRCDQICPFQVVVDSLQIIPEVLSGRKFIALAISEAYAGSDVQGLTTTAVKSQDGKTWTISGSKKWITVRL